MFNPLKLTLRIKIIVAIIFALLISFIFIKPKENNIPVLPMFLQLNITQNDDNSLTLKDTAVVEGYSSDYQTDLQNDYYVIQIIKDKKILFSGKEINKKVTINEWLYENPRADIIEESLGDFVLKLPYYKEATKVVINDEDGKEALQVDLTTQNFVIPKIKNSCGDGVCTDNENLIMCYSDCNNLLPKWNSK